MNYGFAEPKVMAQQSVGMRAPEIPHLMQELSQGLEVMGHALDDLEARLCSIVRAAPPETREPGNQLSAAPSTSHGSAIQSAVFQVTAAGVRLQSLMQRLEV